MDVDIDTAPTFDPQTVFPTWLRASVISNGRMRPHPCGVYPQNIPQDPVTKLAAIPYSTAEDLGYLKIDMLHLNIYAGLKSHDEVVEMANTEPDWSLLRIERNVEKLFQLSKHYKLISTVQPTSLIELADCMALIRPGKAQLLPIYIRNREEARKALYFKDDTGYTFKKAHAIAYALVVVVQLNLIEAGKML